MFEEGEGEGEYVLWAQGVVNPAQQDDSAPALSLFRSATTQISACSLVWESGCLATSAITLPTCLLRH